MEQLTISLPESAKCIMDEEMRTGKWKSPDDFIAGLLDAHRQRQHQKEVETLLLEGLDSGISPMIKDDWDALKRRIWEVHARSGNRLDHVLRPLAKS